VSPRAALGLLRASRARAAAAGRDYVVPDDIKALVVPVLEHRLALTPESQMRGTGRQEVLADVLATVPVPNRAGA
jgi:MoxR-like ATPase